MKASYKDSMQNVVFGESEKAKIRRVILATTVPVKQRSKHRCTRGTNEIK